MIRLPLAGQSTGLEALPLAVVGGGGAWQGNGNLNPQIGDKEVLSAFGHLCGSSFANQFRLVEASM